MLIPFPFLTTPPDAPEPQALGVLGPYFLEQPEHSVVVSALIAYLVVKPDHQESTWAALEVFMAPEFVAAMRERWNQLAGEGIVG